MTKSLSSFRPLISCLYGITICNWIHGISRCRVNIKKGKPQGDTMNLKTLEKDLASDAKHLKNDFIVDLKAEGRHIADPQQCGVIVRRHFSGLLFTLLAFTVFVIGAASVGIYLYMHR